MRLNEPAAAIETVAPCQLAPLTLRDSDHGRAYRIAGGDIRSVFAPEAVAAIFGSSGGIPRTISVVCDNALVSGFALDQRPVGPSVIADVCRDFDLPEPNRAAAGDGGSSGVARATTEAPAVAAAASLIRLPVATVPVLKTTLGLRVSDARLPAGPPEREPRWGFRSLFVRTASR